MWALKYVYRNLHASAADPDSGQVSVKNWFDFTNAKDIAEGLWEIKAGGTTVASGKFPDLDIAPGSQKEFHLALPRVQREPGAEYWLNTSFVLKRDTPWAAKGHEIAWDQFKLKNTEPAPVFAAPKAAALEIVDDSANATLSGPEFSMRVDKQSGFLTQYRYRGTDLLERGPRPDFWRAPTNNDRGAWKVFSERAATDKSLDIEVWKDAGPLWEERTSRSPGSARRRPALMLQLSSRS